jgi:hypothetical protein
MTDEVITTENIVTDTPVAKTPEPKPEPKVSDKPTVDPEEFERTRSALAKANKEAADRRLKLKEWEELGVDTETVKSLLQMQREAEIKKAEELGQYQENIDRMRKETQSKVEAANGEVQAIKQRLEKQLKSKAIEEAILAEDGVKMVLEPHISSRIKLVEVGDEYDLQVTDENGLPMLDEKGNAVPLRKFVASFREHPELKYGFKAQKVSGTGMGQGSSSSATGSNPSTKGLRRGTMTDDAAADFVAKHGIKEYKKLPF